MLIVVVGFLQEEFSFGLNVVKVTFEALWLKLEMILLLKILDLKKESFVGLLLLSLLLLIFVIKALEGEALTVKGYVDFFESLKLDVIVQVIIRSLYCFCADFVSESQRHERVSWMHRVDYELSCFVLLLCVRLALVLLFLLLRRWHLRFINLFLFKVYIVHQYFWLYTLIILNILVFWIHLLQFLNFIIYFFTDFFDLINFSIFIFFHFFLFSIS